MNKDLNHSSIVDMRVKLSAGVMASSPMRATSRSMTRLPSHRSVKSQKSLVDMEKGWTTKFSKAKALDEKPTTALYRPLSPEAKKAVNSPALSKLSKAKLTPDLNNKEKIEFR